MSTSKSQGYALLEALVALLVISIGLIGFARLQLVGMSSSTTSSQRSKAVSLAYEMTDRMRANLAGYAAGAYDNLTGSAANPGCVSTGCSAAQTAQNDYYEWSNELSTLLPKGTGVVCLTSVIGTPGTPAIPATPADPGGPGVPATPAIPAQPAKPAKPATPDAPGCDGVGSTYAVMIWWTENGQQQLLSSTFKP
ncbi:type IV pilus modification protein PilV [Ralstonia soli]|uniref:Type IV pilus modification protein PilV n=1 Tax=Ralstonia soli TaxID=2953896 RepID=A0ABT1AJD8_9RALS|nr:type IV pilus modification protein PilV [Ralstonia soli]MCO5398441.1 type IV pilus modification protein PilV [Ralstonia soli]